MCCLKIQCEFWCTRIIQHISGFSFHSPLFSLTTKIWLSDINLHQKKSYLIYIAWNYHSTWIFAQKKSIFSLSTLAQVCCTLCKSQGLRFLITGWLMPSPHSSPRAFTLIILGSITYQFHEQIPCTRCRRMHSNSQGWEGMFFQIQPHLPYSSALGKMHWSEPERMGFLLIFYQPLGIAPSHN